jgi:Ca-activated chloride channel homolog
MDAALMDPASAPRAQLVSLDGRPYPLDSARLEARAEGGISVTTLHQRFRNPHAEALEVVYTLPLPADGAVLGYTITIGERRIVGEVQPRAEAEAAYREAVYEGRTAGLLEQDRADTFQQQLGNIPGMTTVEVEIRVLHPLLFRAGAPAAEWEYRFPTTVVVRYMGAEGRVADADRLDPNRTPTGTPARLSLALAIADPVAAEGVQSLTHALTCREEGGEVRIELKAPAPLDRDVVLRWAATTPKVGVRVVEGGGLEGDDGRYALLTVLPPTIPVDTFRRDVTILLDASGSMHGLPLDLAKRVIETLLRSLDADDRFEVLAFDSSVKTLTRGLIRANRDSVHQTLTRLGRLQASGGTEMRSAVERALRPLRRDAQRQVVLVTDGYIGFEEEVVAEAVDRLPDEVRLHVAGVGSAPNRTLTAGLARAGRGMEIFAMDETSAEDAGQLLRNATARPILTGLTVTGSALREVAPARPRDVLAGQPAVLSVELEREGGTLELHGRVAGDREPWTWSITVPPSGGALELPWTPLPLGALHGREAIADLEISPHSEAHRSGIDREIERRALRHRIVSRCTSLVAMAETPSVDPLAPRRKERLAVELPAGVSAEGAGLFPVQERVVGISAHERLAPLSIFEPSGDMGRIEASRSPSLVSPPSWIPSRLQLDAADVLHLEEGLLVVEFDVPFDGFLLPTGNVSVLIDGDEAGTAGLDSRRSTPAGPHVEGVRVRLALRLEPGTLWQSGETVEIIWQPDPSSPGAIPCALALVLPPAGQEGGVA